MSFRIITNKAFDTTLLLNKICMFNPFFVSLCQQDTRTDCFCTYEMLFFCYSLKGLSYQILFLF